MDEANHQRQPFEHRLVFLRKNKVQSLSLKVYLLVLIPVGPDHIHIDNLNYLLPYQIVNWHCILFELCRCFTVAVETMAAGPYRR